MIFFKKKRQFNGAFKVKKMAYDDIELPPKTWLHGHITVVTIGCEGIVSTFNNKAKHICCMSCMLIYWPASFFKVIHAFVQHPDFVTRLSSYLSCFSPSLPRPG